MTPPILIAMVVFSVLGIQLLERAKRTHSRVSRIIDDVLGTVFVLWGAGALLAGVRVSIQGEDWGMLATFGTGAIGIVAYLVIRRPRRLIYGHCQRCGYDLTGNTSGVCSECGEKKPPRAESALACLEQASDKG